MKAAVLVLTEDGLALARRLAHCWPGRATIFGPSCIVGSCGMPGSRLGPSPEGPSPKIFATGEPGVLGWSGPLRLVFPEIWGEYDTIVAVMAPGIIIRLIGPLALDPRRTPAVVAVDDAGRFAISLIGGHTARVDDRARDVALALGATPVVVTTAGAAHPLQGTRPGQTRSR